MKLSKADLSLIVGALGLAVSLGLGLVAAAVLGAFLLGLAIGRRPRGDP
jgi:hypothetical protein